MIPAHRFGRVTSSPGSASRRAVRGILSLFAAVMLLTSLGFSTIAHASEPFGCSDMSPSATMAVKADCAMIAVPADADRGTPHRHMVCHADQIAALDDEAPVSVSRLQAGQFAAGQIASLLASPSRVALEPPQA